MVNEGGYNLSPKGGIGAGDWMSKEHKQKLGLARKGTTLTAEHIQHIKEGRKGKGICQIHWNKGKTKINRTLPLCSENVKSLYMSEIEPKTNKL